MKNKKRLRNDQDIQKRHIGLLICNGMALGLSRGQTLRTNQMWIFTTIEIYSHTATRSFISNKLCARRQS